MRFSIIIPIYNVKCYLSECLDSIEAQTFSDYEVVLVDDGSNDGSEIIASRYAAKHEDKVILVKQENRGLYEARKVGLAHARGKYVVSLDSDDYLRADALDCINSAIEKSDAGIVCFGYSRTPDFSLAIAPCLAEGEYSSEELRAFFCQTNKFNSIVTKSFRRDLLAISDLPSFDRLNMGEDALYTCALLRNITQVVFVNKPLYYYRKNTDSISSAIRASCLSDLLAVYATLKGSVEDWADCDGLDYIGMLRGRTVEEVVSFAMRYSAENAYDSSKAHMSLAAVSEPITNLQNASLGHLRSHSIILGLLLQKKAYFLIWLFSKCLRGARRVR